MFFNTDILYRNGPLALVWLAGNGDSIMRSGPTKSKYKRDIMRADLHQLIEIILEQIPSVGSSNGLSLKKIVSLYHGVVVIHHMQLDASLKRLNQLYLEACKIRDVGENNNEIDNVVPACTNLVPKMPIARNLLNTSSDFQLQVPCSPRALPHPLDLENDGFGFGKITGLEEMIAEETRFEESRRNKRKEGNADLNEHIPAKLPRHLEFDGEPLNIQQSVSEPFDDWNIGPDPAFGAAVLDNITADPYVDDAEILQNAECTIAAATNASPTAENLESGLERANINISPENRPTTSSTNLLPLKPIQETEFQEKRRRKIIRVLFNEETELSAETINRQAKAALGLDGHGPKSIELQRRASSMHAPTTTEYFRNLKGLKLIENAGRKIDGASLVKFKNNLLSNSKNYRREIMNQSEEQLRSAEESNISKDSRVMANRNLKSPNVSDANEAQHIPHLMTPQPVEPEMMETIADQDNFPNEIVAPMDEESDVLHQDMVLFSAKRKLSPNKDMVSFPPEHNDQTVDEDFLLDSLKEGRTKFSDIFPPSKFTRLQVSQGFMLLLRMQGEKKIVMTQSQPKNNYRHGLISVRILITK